MVVCFVTSERRHSRATASFILMKMPMMRVSSFFFFDMCFVVIHDVEGEHDTYDFGSGAGYVLHLLLLFGISRTELLCFRELARALFCVFLVTVTYSFFCWGMGRETPLRVAVCAC